MQKNVTYTTLVVTIVFRNVQICGPGIAYLENITNLEILLYLLHFLKS